MKTSKFRGWVHNLWIENCEERQLYADGQKLSESEYFHRFKWWLRREYRHQCQREIKRKELNERYNRWA
jgi:hypothetical protein